MCFNSLDGALPSKFEAASGPGRLNAVIVTADPATGKATAIERLNLSAQDVEACFSPDYHLRAVDQIFKRVFGRS